MKSLQETKVLAFDADDTLWDCQSFFEEVEREYCRFLAPYGDEETISSEFYKIEMGNMQDLGYGTKAFVISLLENALRVSNYRLTARETERIIEMGRALLYLPATPLPGVVQTLAEIRSRSRYRMVLFTKGDQLEQENKLMRSGLRDFFDDVVIVSEKVRGEYTALCRRFNVAPDGLVMIGNSFKSDIEPALAAGCRAVHIPFHVIWKFEHADTFEHERLTTLTQFDELASLF